MRELGVVKFDSKTYSDRNMILNFNLATPAEIDMNLTYLWGRDEDRFPLLTLTAGQGAIDFKVKVNGGDTQYTWPIATRLRVTSRVKKLITTTDAPGINFGTIEVLMEDNWFIYQHTAISPSGVQFRIQNEGVASEMGGYIYRFTNMSGNAENYAPTSDFNPGAVWALGAPTIPGSKSDGNRSNNQAPAKAINQYGYYRFSKEIAGNMSNLVVNIEFPTEGGGTTNLWMPYEMKVWEITRREMLEEDLWFSEYNRDVNGIIHLTDEKTGEAIPRGAGVRDILRAVGNYETYGPILTLSRLDRIIHRIFDSRIDTIVKEIVLYCGKGFSYMFNDAIYRDARFKNYFVTLGANEIESAGGWMSYGKYFNKYKLINGQTLTIKVVDIFDNGIRARRDREAGRTYNGLPLTSYTAVFMDHSLGMDNKSNIQFVCEEGREYKAGVYLGMADVPDSWRAAKTNQLSDRQDIASYEVLGSQGINIKNPTTSFWLDFALE